MEFGSFRYAPDPDFAPAQPRVIFTVDMTLKPKP
jgi:hypothetical protein